MKPKLKSKLKPKLKLKPKMVVRELAVKKVRHNGDNSKSYGFCCNVCRWSSILSEADFQDPMRFTRATEDAQINFAKHRCRDFDRQR
jgi:hypothetical protein